MVDHRQPTPHQRLAERRRARAERRAAIWRRLGVLLAALAVPALAAETGFAPELARAPAAAQAEMLGFETPGESFPGSAFYYLEDAPIAVNTLVTASTIAAEAELVQASGSSIGPMAAALVAVGSDRDHARAQQCMTQAIYYEAASESDAGQRAVAQVVLNRVAHSAWPSTVCGVVYQGSARSTGCQFSFTCDGSLDRRPSPGGWERAGRIARAALAGEVYAPVGLSTHYHTLAVSPYWAPSLSRTTVIGAHVFYRWPGAAGEPAAFATRYLGGEPSPARSNSHAVGPDPVELAHVASFAAIPQAEPAPAQTAAQTAPQTGQAPVENALPTTGGVRPEYANSGRWIARP